MKAVVPSDETEIGGHLYRRWSPTLQFRKLGEAVICSAAALHDRMGRQRLVVVVGGIGG